MVFNAFAALRNKGGFLFQYGKVLKVFSPEDKEIESADRNVQALVEMWDEIILTCGVAAQVSGKIKAGDFVVTEISPLSQNVFRHTVVKLLKGKAGADAWAEYKRIFNKRSQNAETPSIDLDIPKGRMIR